MNIENPRSIKKKGGNNIRRYLENAVSSSPLIKFSICINKNELS